MTKQQWFAGLGDLGKREAELIDRCYDTITGNIYTEGEYLWSPYRCTSPCKSRFDGVWNWDTAFHALGFSRWDTELAKENITGFFKFQRGDGQLPDVLYEDGRIIFTASKPPFFAWAVQQVYNRDGSKKFLEEMYPALVRNASFWEKNRSNGEMFFYDAENKGQDDYLMFVGFESGWDNSVRWDGNVTDYYPVDLNCFMVMTYRALSYMASELGKDDDSAVWIKKAARLAALVNERMWDSNNCYYSDLIKSTGKVSNVLSPASFMPLFINIASEEQAECMGKVAVERFKGKMPTVSFDHPGYSNDYWRGPTWLNVAFFAAKGLKNYGLSVADTIRENILDMCYNEKDGIFENYDSVTGKGLCCSHFSWSAVFIIEFILNW
ncbi:MAG: hypothetical protein IKV97_06210 [Clostridia bacterium]|nr:hypothetical protein [Clostridia bacterium]